MFKYLLTGALIIGSVAIAQSRSTLMRDLTAEVEALVENYGDRLSSNDERLVNRNLREIVSIFRASGYGTPTNPPNPYPSHHLFCDASDNTLRDLDNASRVIWDFGNPSNCQEALGYVARGEPFCDYSDNTLHRSDASLVHDFGKPDDCRAGREAVVRYRPFCDFSDNTLWDSNGKLIYDFGNPQDCIRARDSY